MSYPCDIEDADTWIAKAALLGLELLKHQEDIDDHAWRYSIIIDKENFFSRALEDWPGRCAKIAVELLQKRSEDAHI